MRCGIGKYTVCRHVRASFSPEMLQAGAVKGLRVAFAEPEVQCFQEHPSCMGGLHLPNYAIGKIDNRGHCQRSGKQPQTIKMLKLNAFTTTMTQYNVQHFGTFFFLYTHPNDKQTLKHLLENKF